MTWQGVLILVGLAGSLIGLGTLVRPLPRLWISTRRRAGLLLVASLAIGASGLAAAWWMRTCGCQLPPINAELLDRLNARPPRVPD